MRCGVNCRATELVRRRLLNEILKRIRSDVSTPWGHLYNHDTFTHGCLVLCSLVCSGSRSSKTFKPKKNIPEGSHQYELLKHAEATLGSGNLRQAVMLPEGEDLNEWIAVNTVDFFNQINMLYGTITEFCTETSCPVMSAGPRYEYHWADGTNIKKPIKCSAPKYIDYLMTWVQDQLDDETLFPSKIGVPFPKNFMSVAKTILKRLFRVYAHIYHQHFDSVIQLQEEAHLNTSFKHFIFFVQEFNLIDRRELAPLQDLIEKLGSKDR
uniref:MOB kinase activator 1A n=2 Tax=Clupeocephala TaxID=186625 RepID=A0A3B5MIA6_9TELE